MAVVTTTIDNGRLTVEVAGHPAIVVDPAQLPANLVEYAALHGLKQRLVDAAAIPRDPDTGRSATAADKYAAVRRVWDHMTATGEWNLVRGSGGGSDGLLVAALMEACGLTREQAREAVAGWDRPLQEAMRERDPVIAPIVQRLRMERARTVAGAVDTAAVLEGLRQRTAG